METFLDLTHYDLVTPDGYIISIKPTSDRTAEATFFIENISKAFVGFDIDKNLVHFNLKSALAQLGIEGIAKEIKFNKEKRCAEVHLDLLAFGEIAREMLKHIKPGCRAGKLFAADPRRRVRDPDYLSRMFGRSDRKGRPLLSLGGLHGSSDLILDKVDGRTIAYLTLQNGRLEYDDTIMGFLPTLGKSLIAGISMRILVGLHQEWKSFAPKNIKEDECLLVKTLPLHIRTAFARVVPELLSEGYHHTSASILQPDTEASGDIYELYGSSKREITDIPLEFYTLEPYREYVFFQDRDQLLESLEQPKVLFEAFETAPQPIENRAAVFIVKGTQLKNLKSDDWISHRTHFHEFPGIRQISRQALMVERYIEQQVIYPYLKKISDGLITSQGILLTRYFPSPLLKRMLLSDTVQRGLKGIYFQYPSLTEDFFFSSEDRALLHDLQTFAIPVFWVDKVAGKILQYVSKPERETGLFVPIDEVDNFIKSTVFGIYGSNLIEGNFEGELHRLLQGILAMRETSVHPLLHKNKPLSLVTGGGPGVMEMGNKVAKELGILSCANIVDFRSKEEGVINEQKINVYIDAKMTYRLDKLVERQAEFDLDLPIFLMGGIGTDFELCLEEVSRKVGIIKPTPIMLFGDHSYWRQKITSRFQANCEQGTNRGSEWLSNCFYCIQNAEEGLKIYKNFFDGKLSIGSSGPIYPEGFATAANLTT